MEIMETVVSITSNGKTSLTDVPAHRASWGEQERQRHVKNGDSPVFDALVAELGDPYREPVIAMKNPKEKVEKNKEVTVEDVERIIKQEKISTHTRAEEVSIEFAKLRKMTRPQLLSYIATNKELLPKGMKAPNSQARKSELLYVAQHVARGKF